MPSDSHIHAMYGHIDEFLYWFVAGIQQDPSHPTSNTWDKVLIAPAIIPELKSVNCTFESPRGEIRSSYTMSSDSDPLLTMRIYVAPGIEATVLLPLSQKKVLISSGREHVLLDQIARP